MAAPVHPETISWATVFISVAVSAVTAVIAALLTGLYNVRASRQQAVDSEIIKLRHDLTKRRVDQFNAAMERLKLMYANADSNASFCECFKSNSVGYLADEICSYASLVPSSADYAHVSRARQAFVHAIIDMMDARMDPKLLGDAYDNFDTCIRALEGTVDWAAERRLHATAKGTPPRTEVQQQDWIRKRFAGEPD
jgi:hypothetical protein